MTDGCERLREKGIVREREIEERGKEGMKEGRSEGGRKGTNMKFSFALGVIFSCPIYVPYYFSFFGNNLTPRTFLRNTHRPSTID